MIPYKLLTWLLAVKAVLCSCQYEKRESGFAGGNRAYKVTKTGELPKSVNESSGLAADSAGRLLWTHNDGGSPPDLFAVNQNGRLLRTVRLSGLRNEDWEDLARDTAGRLYIGDFGNNGNRRQNLAIYRVHPDRPAAIDTLRFRYEDQAAFPPPPAQRNFDCEAFFWHADSLYLFSKNRGSRTVKMYVLPAAPGTHVARVRGTVRLKSMVTAADINPARTELALLSYGKVFVYTITDRRNLLSGPHVCVKLARGQAEALAYVNNTDFMVTNEKGKMYLLTRRRPTP